MQPQTTLIAFLQEIFQRFKTKSPKFFKVWQWISAALVMITSLPQLLSQVEGFGIVLPESAHSQLAIAVRYAGIGILLMSLLTTQSKPAAITEDGTVLKKTDEQKLPFTAGAEQKTAIKEMKAGNLTQVTTT